MKNLQEQKPTTKLHIVIIFWGKEYGEFFRDYASKNLNHLLEEIPRDIDFTLKIYCDSISLDKFGNLSNGKKFHICSIDNFLNENGNKYDKSCFIQNIAINEAFKDNAAMFHFLPDQILSKGTMKFAINKLREGFRLVCMPSARCNKSFIGKIPIYEESKNLVRFALDNMHQFFKDMEWDRWGVYRQKFSCTPYAVIKSFQDGYFIKAFQGYPILLYPYKKVDMKHCIDGDVLNEVISNKNEAYFVKDSDEAFTFDVSPNEWNYSYISEAHNKKTAIREVLEACSCVLSPIHYDFFLNTYSAHVGQAGDRSFEKEVNEIIHENFHSCCQLQP